MKVSATPNLDMRCTGTQSISFTEQHFINGLLGDMRIQADTVFANIAEVLALGGATLDDVVKITAWLTDMDQYSGYNDARAAAFSNRLPASATVHSPRLVRDDLLVEVEAVAILGAA